MCVSNRIQVRMGWKKGIHMKYELEKAWKGQIFWYGARKIDNFEHRKQSSLVRGQLGVQIESSQVLFLPEEDNQYTHEWPEIYS